MASYNGVLSAAKDEEAAGTKATPGMLASFVRGLRQFPADMPRVMRMGPGLLRPGGNQAMNSAMMEDSDAAAQRMATASGISAPVTFPERVAQSVGRSSPLTAAGVAGAGAVFGPVGAGLELAADVAATMFQQKAADKGMSPAAQAAIGIGTAIAMPGPSDVAGVADDATKLASRLSAKRAGEAAEGIASRLGVGKKKVLEASSEMKRRLPLDPTGGDRFVDEAHGSLEKAQLLFPDPSRRPTSVQIVGEDAGYNLTAMERSLANDDLDFASALEGRRQTVIRDLTEEYERLLPNGTAGGANAAFEASFDTAKAGERALWEGFRSSTMPVVSIAPLMKAVKQLESGVKAGIKYLPNEIDIIKQFPNGIPLDELQGLRSELLTTQRLASRSLDDTVRRKGQRVGVLLDAITEQIDGLNPAIQQKYRSALDASSELAKRFDPRSAAVKALSDSTEGRRMARIIKGSSDPGGEAKRAVEILSSQPKGVDNLRRVFIDELFDEDMESRTPRAILNEIRRNRNVYREVFGPKLLGQYETFMDKAQMSRRITSGSTAAAKMTASNVKSPADIMFGGIELATEPVQSSARIVGSIMNKYVKTHRERNRIMREAFLDTDLLDTLLTMPTERAIPMWVKGWDKLVSRSRARAQAAGRATYRAGNNTQEGQ